MSLKPGGIMALAIGVYFLAATIPGALTTFFAVDTTTWDAGTVALFGLIPLGIVAVIVLTYTRGVGKGE